MILRFCDMLYLVTQLETQLGTLVGQAARGAPSRGVINRHFTRYRGSPHDIETYILALLLHSVLQAFIGEMCHGWSTSPFSDCAYRRVQGSLDIGTGAPLALPLPPSPSPYPHPLLLHLTHHETNDSIFGYSKRNRSSKSGRMVSQFEILKKAGRRG